MAVKEEETYKVAEHNDLKERSKKADEAKSATAQRKWGGVSHLKKHQINASLTHIV
jgi:hypothetical protein